jgi:hypothetical protein
MQGRVPAPIPKWDFKGGRNMTKKIVGSITGIVSLLAVAVFMLLGFYASAWPLAWLVFLAIPITSITLNMFVKKPEENAGPGSTANPGNGAPSSPDNKVGF